MKPDIVVLGTVQSDDFSQAQWTQGTERILDVLSPATGHVYILRGTPHLPFDGPKCLAAGTWLGSLRSTRGRCEAPVFNAHDDTVYRWLQNATARFDNVTAIDMNPSICPNGECRAERDDTVVFRDSQHLTASFAQTLGHTLLSRMGLAPPPEFTAPNNSAR
jgi:hypothetical protein